ncbi:hypothetical protein J6590_074330 [Homalodisca vitripennis]|nr:hypothetical protein J6590_074330 [Homalodisca vitripennis]
MTTMRMYPLRKRPKTVTTVSGTPRAREIIPSSTQSHDLLKKISRSDCERHSEGREIIPSAHSHMVTRLKQCRSVEEILEVVAAPRGRERSSSAHVTWLLSETV